MNEFHMVIENYLLLSALLFGAGLLGVLLKKSVLAKVFCLQLMLSSVHLAFSSFSAEAGVQPLSVHLDWFLGALALAQFFIGLGVVTFFFRQYKSLDSDAGQELRQ